MSETNENKTGAAEKLESSSRHAKKALDAAVGAGRTVGETVKTQAKVAVEAGKEHLGAAAKDLTDAASVTYGDLRSQAKSKTEEYRGRAQDFIGDASSCARDYQSQAEVYVRENPLQAVGLALGVGFLLGILLRR
jgi:ElaB/YqjD/DUF883 family membrane-anchored ribosome-binding protein